MKWACLIQAYVNATDALKQATIALKQNTVGILLSNLSGIFAPCGACLFPLLGDPLYVAVLLLGWDVIR